MCKKKESGFRGEREKMTGFAPLFAGSRKRKKNQRDRLDSKREKKEAAASCKLLFLRTGEEMKGLANAIQTELGKRKS